MQRLLSQHDCPILMTLMGLVSDQGQVPRILFVFDRLGNSVSRTTALLVVLPNGRNVYLSQSSPCQK